MPLIVNIRQTQGQQVSRHCSGSTQPRQAPVIANLLNPARYHTRTLNLFKESAARQSTATAIATATACGLAVTEFQGMSC